MIFKFSFPIEKILSLAAVAVKLSQPGVCLFVCMYVCASVCMDHALAFDPLSTLLYSCILLVDCIFVSTCEDYFILHVARNIV